MEEKEGWKERAEESQTHGREAVRSGSQGRERWNIARAEKCMSWLFRPSGCLFWRSPALVFLPGDERTKKNTCEWNGVRKKGWEQWQHLRRKWHLSGRGSLLSFIWWDGREAGSGSKKGVREAAVRRTEEVKGKMMRAERSRDSFRKLNRSRFQPCPVICNLTQLSRRPVKKPGNIPLRRSYRGLEHFIEIMR